LRCDLSVRRSPDLNLGDQPARSLPSEDDVWANGRANSLSVGKTAPRFPTFGGCGDAAGALAYAKLARPIPRAKALKQDKVRDTAMAVTRM